VRNSPLDKHCDGAQELAPTTFLLLGVRRALKVEGFPWNTSRSAQSYLSSFHTRICTGFLVFPLYESHVYSSTGSEAEALSEYGVVTKVYWRPTTRLLTGPLYQQCEAWGPARVQREDPSNARPQHIWLHCLDEEQGDVMLLEVNQESDEDALLDFRHV
jgi:hypothetical protein